MTLFFAETPTEFFILWAICLVTLLAPKQRIPVRWRNCVFVLSKMAAAVTIVSLLVSRPDNGNVLFNAIIELAWFMLTFCLIEALVDAANEDIPKFYAKFCRKASKEN